MNSSSSGPQCLCKAFRWPGEAPPRCRGSSAHPRKAPSGQHPGRCRTRGWAATGAVNRGALEGTGGVAPLPPAFLPPPSPSRSPPLPRPCSSPHAPLPDESGFVDTEPRHHRHFRPHFVTSLWPPPCGQGREAPPPWAQCPSGQTLLGVGPGGAAPAGPAVAGRGSWGPSARPLGQRQAAPACPRCRPRAGDRPSRWRGGGGVRLKRGRRGSPHSPPRPALTGTGSGSEGSGVRRSVRTRPGLLASGMSRSPPPRASPVRAPRRLLGRPGSPAGSASAQPGLTAWPAWCPGPPETLLLGQGAGRARPWARAPPAAPRRGAVASSVPRGSCRTRGRAAVLCVLCPQREAGLGDHGPGPRRGPGARGCRAGPTGRAPAPFPGLPPGSCHPPSPHVPRPPSRPCAVGTGPRPGLGAQWDGLRGSIPGPLGGPHATAGWVPPTDPGSARCPGPHAPWPGRSQIQGPRLFLGEGVRWREGGGGAPAGVRVGALVPPQGDVWGRPGDLLTVRAGSEGLTSLRAEGCGPGAGAGPVLGVGGLPLWPLLYPCWGPSLGPDPTPLGDLGTATPGQSHVTVETGSAWGWARAVPPLRAAPHRSPHACCPGGLGAAPTGVKSGRSSRGLEALPWRGRAGPPGACRTGVRPGLTPARRSKCSWEGWRSAGRVSGRGNWEEGSFAQEDK